VIATIVDTKALWETVVAAFIAGVGTTIIFSFAILGASKFGEANRDGNRTASAVFGGLMVLALLGTAAAITVGVIVMTAD
jgi:hypothetical protein